MSQAAIPHVGLSYGSLKQACGQLLVSEKDSHTLVSDRASRSSTTVLGCSSVCFIAAGPSVHSGCNDYVSRKFITMSLFTLSEADKLLNLFSKDNPDHLGIQ